MTRVRLSELGEYYDDLLKIDATINARTVPAQAASNLCAKLQEREAKIKERVEYLAKKHDKTFEEMWKGLLDGDYSPTEDS